MYGQGHQFGKGDAGLRLHMDFPLSATSYFKTIEAGKGDEDSPVAAASDDQVGPVADRKKGDPMRSRKAIVSAVSVTSLGKTRASILPPTPIEVWRSAGSSKRISPDTLFRNSPYQVSLSSPHILFPLSDSLQKCFSYLPDAPRSLGQDDISGSHDLCQMLNDGVKTRKMDGVRMTRPPDLFTEGLRVDSGDRLFTCGIDVGDN